MAPSTTRQSWAISRRYFITLLRSPFSALFRLILLPGIIFVLLGNFLYNYSSNQDVIKSIKMERFISFICLILTTLHIWTTTEIMVIDRSVGMKSLMISMGLKKRAWYFGYLFSFTVLVFPIIAIIATLSIRYIFVETKTSIFAIYLVFILFYINITALTFTFVSIISAPQWAFISLLFLIMQAALYPLLTYSMSKLPSDSYPFLLFLVSISPYQSLQIFCDSYTHCKHDCGIGVSTDKLLYQPIYLTLLSMTLWSIILYAFPYWFDEVCPWQNDSARKNLCFCLEGPLMNKYNNLIPDDTYQDPTYFEQVPNHQQNVGISIKRITKKFKKLVAVDNLSLDIYKGETTLLLGHNGAGKTTLMNIILGKLSQDEGVVEISKSSTKCIGVCPQSSVLDQNLSVRQHLELFAEIKSGNMTFDEREADIQKTIQDVSLENHFDKQPLDLSGGMRRKLSLAMAFVGHSDVLILDEPSSGLDPDSRVFIWNAIRNYRKDRTVLLSTQHMEEADYMGDRIAIMAEGRIICCGSSIFLNDALGNCYKLRIECDRSKEYKIMSFIHKYFPSAKQTTSSGSECADGELIVELNGDKKSQDLEIRLIDMLEYIENNPLDAHHIKSFGLKSSSIEDVMHNTSKIQSNRESADSQTTLLISSVQNQIEILTRARRKQPTTSFETQKSILYALLVKQIHTYKRDWISLMFYRVLIPIWMLWVMMNDLSSHVSFSPNPNQAFVVFHLVYYPTVERISKFKTMQLTSSASPTTFWLSHFITDFASVLLWTVAINILHIITFDGIYVSSKLTVHLILTLAMLLYGISGILLAYVLSTILKDSKTCISYHVLLYLSSLMVYIATKFLGIVTAKDLSWLSSITDNFFIMLLPSDAMQYTLTGLTTRCYIRTELIIGFCQDDGEVSPLMDAQTRFSPVVVGLAANCIQIVAYYVLLTLIEQMNVDLNWYLRWANLMSCFRRSPTVSDLNSTSLSPVDQDVLDESLKTAQLIDCQTTKQGQALLASKLEKSYIYSKKVIDQLSFRVGQGECFGLLGVNGAGKSTTFSMLAAELKPDAGQIWANGDYLFNVYRQYLSYDPQSEPETSLSSQEVLYLMARLRLVEEECIGETVTAIMELLQMNKHAHKTAKELSGGTKRKLALGMSLIGNPHLALLDEPTAGVDPLARVDIWSLLKSLRLKNNTSIVISSHAMEECEAVCDRIAIMARGRLRCIGTFLHLRSKFSQGCRVNIQLAHTTDSDTTTAIVNELNQRLQATFNYSIELVDTNLNSAKFNIADNTVKRSALLRVLREFKQKYPDVHYSVNDSSLEDIFTSLAKEQMLEEQARGPR